MLVAVVLLILCSSSKDFFYQTMMLQAMSPLNSGSEISFQAGAVDTEVVFILVALGGMFQDLLYEGKRFLWVDAGFCLSFLSVFLIFKQGTGAYIVTIIEPFVALLATYVIFKLAETSSSPRSHILSKIIGMLSAMVLSVYQYDLQSKMVLDWSNRDDSITQCVAYIRNHSKDDDLVLVPAYLAFKAQRRLALEFAEIFLWSVAHILNDPATIGLASDLTTLAENEAVKIVLRENHIPFTLPEFDKALRAN